MRVPMTRDDFSRGPDSPQIQDKKKVHKIPVESGGGGMGSQSNVYGGGCEGGGPMSKDVHVNRPALTVTQRSTNYHYCPPHDLGMGERLRNKVKETCACSTPCLTSTLTSRLPILSWLPSYSFKTSLLGDVVAGVTVAIMHIPQGMAYALLAGLPPIVGLYMAFFPVLMYAFLGTSRHCSVGTFAVVCLMTGKVVGDLATSPDEAQPPTTTDALLHNATNTTTYTPIQVAAVVALMNGIVQIVLGSLQLGSLCVFLSDMLVSGFTTGAAVHVLTSQIKYLFGIQVVRYSGPFKIIYTYRDIIRQIMFSNPAAMVLSGLTIGTISFNNEVLKPWFRTKTKIPIPIELMVVIVGTVASYFGQLNDNFDIRIVGVIPTGIPTPTPPPVELMPVVLMDATIISIVAYTVSFSMSKIFAKRHNYNVDATQELYALGASNVFGSFFGCAPIAASLSRSLIQEAVGGVTQITSFICCSLILLVLLFVGPVFETLPNCVLSSIIVVALKGMFMQVKELAKIWSMSRVDAVIWIVSFLGVVIIDIDYGLALGIIASLLVLLCRTQQPKAACLGHVPNTDLYLDVNKYSSAEEVAAVSIFQFGGPLHFANTEYFRTQLTTLTGLTPSKIASNRELLQKHQLSAPDLTNQSNKESNGSTKSDISDTSTKSASKIIQLFRSRNNNKGEKDAKHVTISLPEVKYLVIEMSSISYLDSSGCNLLTQLYKEYKAAGIVLCLAGPSESVLDTLEDCHALNEIPGEHIFHSTHDAVTLLTSPAHINNSCTRL
ncbi:hypothetical protein Pcinc_040950 [Petrolisthes cinctipes]|uniref:STAS domain-containing protein n=1 Tax=Petrolisthes cinctipes TaxID=88211 RepID=A0AAE1EIY5_PETCI|nr:hypothetical protein Pcinc_040950 [Petrolisthes cinctipes]